MTDTNSTEDVFAPVNMKNEQYDNRRIVEDGSDPIQSAEEDAMAAIKGHIEKQDREGT
ncbi:hypothetical protein [Paenibacillus flagellatus]|uniref:hypothetical protein n=1 Tax=Paenibacillus flagellatus TaxID=2211139 RepID=UPI001475FE5D|nr:hypothetical protein [Paenibacillus flagellatus]